MIRKSDASAPPDYTSDPDVQLMLAFKEGDESAFERLLERYETPVINFIYRHIGARQDAEDLAQEVFLRVYRSVRSFVPQSRFSTWLFRIALNLCLDYRRKRRRDMLGHAEAVSAPAAEGGERELEIPDTGEPSVEATAEHRQTEETVVSALNSLPDSQRFAFSLRVYEEKSYAEIADIMGCSVSSVESLIFRARQSLLKRLTLEQE